MPDLTAIVQNAGTYAWLYLPIAVVLGALHALEPGHAKSLMAAYIIAIKGTASQAITLAISAAVGHTIIVWALAIAALAFGERYIVDQAEPWLTALSGILIVLLSIRMLWALRHRRHYGHDHVHSHGHTHLHEPQIVSGGVTTGQIVWFGFTGGLLPCPSAIAVLLVCIHLKAFGLGIAMVAAFSVGLALTLITIGVVVVWSSGKLASSFPGFDRLALRLPYISSAVVMVVGIIMTFAGLNATGVFGRKPN